MWARQSSRPSIVCNRVRRTEDRPRSEGSYIVRLSPANAKRLKARNGVYLRVSYGKASVLGCLSIDEKLDDETVRIDQTLRHAIGLQKTMQENEELAYSADASGPLKQPIAVCGSGFRGPSLLAKLCKQQYLVSIVHHAIARDMEKPIVRLTAESMEVIGIQPGDKVSLIAASGRKVSVRCLALGAETQLPSTFMWEDFTPPCPDEAYEGMVLPWITVDLQVRRRLDVKPWEPILVGRDPCHALTLEFNHVAAALALSALGGAIVVHGEHLAFLGRFAPFVPFAIVMTGLLGVLMLLLFKIRSRI